MVIISGKDKKKNETNKKRRDILRCPVLCLYYVLLLAFNV